MLEHKGLNRRWNIAQREKHLPHASLWRQDVCAANTVTYCWDCASHWIACSVCFAMLDCVLLKKHINVKVKPFEIKLQSLRFVHILLIQLLLLHRNSHVTILFPWSAITCLQCCIPWDIHHWMKGVPDTCTWASTWTEDRPLRYECYVRYYSGYRVVPPLRLVNRHQLDVHF